MPRSRRLGSSASSRLDRAAFSGMPAGVLSRTALALLRGTFVTIQELMRLRGRLSNLHVTSKLWSSLLDRIELMDRESRLDRDEALWTLLCAYGYASEQKGSELAGLLSGGPPTSCGDLWIEALPFPPRKSEGNTMVDLAAGDIKRRDGTSSGIEFDAQAPDSTSVAILVECKWLSDMSGTTAHDPLRNQITRVLENALTFQGGGRFPERVCFTMLTPRVFRERPRLRGYGLLFQAYKNDPKSIIEDIGSGESVNRKKLNGWTYPRLEDWVPALEFHWVDFETVIEKMPPSEFQQLVRELASRSKVLRFD